MESKNQIRKAKLLRWLGVTKPLILSESEVKLIKLCKLHYRNDERFTNTRGWIETLKPMHNEIYGWDADEHYRDFLQCIFQKLFDIYLKIAYDQSGSNSQLKSIIGAGFEKTYIRDQELPIERVISELCGLIQNNQVVRYGVNHYYL